MSIDLEALITSKNPISKSEIRKLRNNKFIKVDFPEWMGGDIAGKQRLKIVAVRYMARKSLFMMLCEESKYLERRISSFVILTIYLNSLVKKGYVAKFFTGTLTNAKFELSHEFSILKASEI